MTDNGRENLHKRLRRARREAGLTQAALAQQVGCKQSAVSMMEAGRREAMAHDTLVKVAALLKVDLPEIAEPAPQALSHAVSVCGNFSCPSNLPYVVGDDVYFLPLGTVGRGRHCIFCGELLMSVCAHCVTPIANRGGCCGACGELFVELPEGYVEDVPGWVAGRVEAVESLRRFLSAETGTSLSG